MAWQEHHPLPYESKIKEKFLWNFSLDQTGWLLLGAFLSYKLAQWIPTIGNAWVFNRMHYAIPLGVTWLLAYGKEPKTQQPILRYMYRVISLRLRRRKFLYRKKNIIKGGDRLG